MTGMLLRMSEVARILDVRTDRVYQLARDGILPVVRIGRQIRIQEDRLSEWVIMADKPTPAGGAKRVRVLKIIHCQSSFRKG